MSYSTAINSNIINISKDTAESILRSVFGESAVINTYHGMQVGRANDLQVGLVNGSNINNFVIKNTTAGKHAYNLYDVVALLKSQNIPDDIIVNALNQSSVQPNVLSNNAGATTWTPNTVARLNSITTEQATQLTNYVSKHYPNADAQIIVSLKDNGRGYTYQVVYTHPTTGAKVYTTLDGIKSEQLSEPELDNIIGPTTNVGTVLDSTSIYNNQSNHNQKANNQAASEFINAFNQKLKENPNLGTSARSDYNLTDEDIASITANLPDTNNLKAWNLGKDANVYNTLINNLQKNNPQLLERMSLTERQGLADVISGAQQSITERDIKNKQAGALSSITRDPALYEAVTKQLRADSAAGTIAGQRAANAQGIAAEADATYDKHASDLYSSLFGGDKGNIAQQTYTDVFSRKTSELNSSVQGAIDDAIEAQRQGAISLQEYNTILQGLAAAAGVDASTFANAVSERQAVASDNATDLSTKLQGDIKAAMAADDSDLSYVQGLVNDVTKHLNLTSDGSADITNPLTALIEAVAKSPQKYNYTKVSAGDYENAKQFNNQHYQDIVNSDFVKNLLADETIDSLTKAKTIEEFTNDIAKNIGIDELSKEGLKSLYEGYNQEATERSNKVFNQAQRAYIAAITAGDAKTVEQLVKLARNANASKGNLYAASALANQFKQQTGALNSGRQLATDFLKQRDINTANVGEAAKAGGDAWDIFLGNGTDGYDKSTIYGAFNKHLENAAYGKDMYGKFADSVMNTTQKLNDTSVINNIDNWNRLSQMKSEYTSANATTAANKTLNQGTKDNLKASVDALAAMTNPSTVNNYLNNNVQVKGRYTK